MLKILRQEGFASILEVVVASVIFVITALGAFSSIAMIRSQGGGSTEGLEALYVAKRVMDDLRAHVYGNQWSVAASPLNPGTNPHSQTITIGTRSYTVTYNMVDIPNLQARRMDMIVTY